MVQLTTVEAPATLPRHQIHREDVAGWLAESLYLEPLIHRTEHGHLDSIVVSGLAIAHSQSSALRGVFLAREPWGVPLDGRIYLEVAVNIAPARLRKVQTDVRDVYESLGLTHEGTSASAAAASDALLASGIDAIEVAGPEPGPEGAGIVVVLRDGLTRLIVG